MSDYWTDPADQSDKMFCCKDLHLRWFEWGVIKDRLPRSAVGAVLDIGCGRLSSAREQLGRSVIGLDINPVEKDVEKYDVLERLPERHRRRYPVVLLKRVLCNLPDWEHQTQAIKNAMEGLQEGGTLMLCEPDSERYNKVNRIRVDAGLNPLRRPAHNYPVSPVELLVSRSDLQALVDIGIAPEYFYWTRFFLPLVLGREVPYESVSLRTAYPALGPTAKNTFGVHRLVTADLAL